VETFVLLEQSAEKENVDVTMKDCKIMQTLILMDMQMNVIIVAFTTTLSKIQMMNRDVDVHQCLRLAMFIHHVLSIPLQTNRIAVNVTSSVLQTLSASIVCVNVRENMEIVISIMRMDVKLRLLLIPTTVETATIDVSLIVSVENAFVPTDTRIAMVNWIMDANHTSELIPRIVEDVAMIVE